MQDIVSATRLQLMMFDRNMTKPHIEAAKRASQVLYNSVLNDLDEDKAGIGWMTDQINWKHSALIGEYLLSSISGVETALSTSALCNEKFRELELSQNMKIAHVQNSDRSARDPIPPELSTVFHSPNNELLHVFKDHSLISLAQALDRLAAVTVAVGGFKEKLLHTDCGRILEIAAKAHKNGKSGNTLRPGIFADVGTAGRQEQNNLLGLFLDWQRHGPEDWLPWLRQYRSTIVHRAPFVNWTAHTKGPHQNPGESVIRPFYLQPGWAESESMYRTARKGIQDLLLMQPAHTILSGLTESTAQYCHSVLRYANELWSKRRANPELIVQSAGMWPELESSSKLSFKGYSPNLKMAGNFLAINPDRVKRLKATQLLDRPADKWRS
ncbi:hypothetical protein ACPV6D_11400 [Corynebacterium propinquum]|uniref:hypothetical protein n=1 Tax=Corynebacterium propinquum TaxID=43769 RepID=UPI003C9E9036